MKKLTSILCYMLFALQYISAQTIYVDISNNTGIENGSQEHPFNTIAEAMDVAQDGYTISIASGTYPEDSIKVKKCVNISGQGPNSTIVNGTFVLSGLLDTSPVAINDLWCSNILLSDSSNLKTSLIIQDCELQTFTNDISAFDSTGSIVFTNNLVNDSIHLFIASCKGGFDINTCETGSHISISSIVLRDGFARITDNHVNGNLKIATVAKQDTLYITGNTVRDSLIVHSVSSYPDILNVNIIGKGVQIFAVASQGFQFRNNQVTTGRLEADFTALNSSEISDNTFSNGGIDFKATSADLNILSNTIQSDGSVSGIRLETIAGGKLERNTIKLPYLPPSGLSFEEDTSAICGILVYSTAFQGMNENNVQGGSYGVYLSAVASNDFVRNEIEDSHYGFYLSTVSGDVDSNRIENCTGDGMVLNVYPESDTNSIRLNHNVVKDNGGHGIWVKGNALMGNINEPGTGYNIIKNNTGYDLYIETPAALIDTIWAQNNEWSHDTETEVAQLDIYDAADDPSRSVVVFSPILPFGIETTSEVDIEVYPNPVNSLFAIRFSPFPFRNALFNIEKVELTDMFGRVVVKLFEGKITSEQMKFDISHLQAGIYFLRISTPDSTVLMKIIKI